MSRVNDYYAWLLKRAKDNWLASMNHADRAEERLRKLGQGGQAEVEAEHLRTMANAAYEVYATIVADDPGNYSAHKRTTHSRRARRRWLS
jgi:hypothetical protein